MKNLLLVAIAIFGFSAVSFAQPTNTATASANIVTVLTINKIVGGDMNFGNIFAHSTDAGSVVLPPNGGRTLNSVTAPANTGTVSAAKFLITGTGGSLFTLTLPADNTVKVSKSGAPDMNVNTFTSDVTGSTTEGNQSATLEADGGQEVHIGATLSVASSATQTPGQYVSTPFTVTVAYN